MDTAIRVYSFREGLLSGLGHDLALRLNRFRISQSGRSIYAQLDTRSFEVEGAVKHGDIDASALSGSDREKIVASLEKEILRTKAHPEAQFSGRVVGDEPPLRVNGHLTLCGVTQPLSFHFERKDTALRADFELKPSTFGIKPYRALGGTLKVQDRVRVVIEVDAVAVERGGLGEDTERTFTPA